MQQNETDWYSEEAATFGDRLATAREAAGMSPGDLAQRIGVKQSTFEAWENDRKEPRANRLQMLAGLLGVSIRWLLTGVGEGPDVGSNFDTGEDLGDLLTEIRDLRATITQSGVALGQLEKRLRIALKDR